MGEDRVKKSLVGLRREIDTNANHGSMSYLSSFRRVIVVIRPKKKSVVMGIFLILNPLDSDFPIATVHGHALGRHERLAVIMWLRCKAPDPYQFDPLPLNFEKKWLRETALLCSIRLIHR